MKYIQFDTQINLKLWILKNDFTLNIYVKHRVKTNLCWVPRLLKFRSPLKQLKRPHRVVELHPLATLYNYLRQCGWANALRHTNSIKKSSVRTKRDSFMHFSPCFRCPCRCPPGAAPPSIPAHRLREARRVGHPDDGRLCGSAATARRLGMGISASGGRLRYTCRQDTTSPQTPAPWRRSSASRTTAIRRPLSNGFWVSVFLLTTNNKMCVLLSEELRALQRRNYHATSKLNR